ncbi:MAG TPA: F0F1 ATP synthase subunit gamma [Casimicrobiaceae bacterium]|nr:F0F1 ATP synthase subunit gamma [Casimicrobiaceae bacterium]
MTQRREVEARLALYDDLSGILGAMRSFALVELHRVARREAAQQQLVGTLSETLRDVAPALPAPQLPASDVWVLFGSVRGFCGSFNEDILRAWQAAGSVTSPVVAVGERLQSLLPRQGSLFPVRGATGAVDAASAIDRILAAVSAATRSLSREAGLVACVREDAGPWVQRLLPLTISSDGSAQEIPLTNEPPERVSAGVAEHYLFHTLLALMLRSIRVENHMRLLQMENAMQHLDRGRDELKRQLNRLRQEEIIEEIELMMVS